MLTWFRVFALLIISSKWPYALEVRSCSSKKPLPLSVEVDGCNKEPCKVINKSNIHFAINFEVPEETEKLRAHAKAFLEGVLLPYDVPKEDLDACKFLKNATCPLQKGEIVHYELIAPVNAPMAGPTVDLEFELIGDDDKIAFCVRCKVRITSHSSKLADE
ncbi:hypothetical protein HA402_005841 [Bradysia odoriphaga]|nr:hypothetical protein HA402_005841 [Bradysia odoriphaga]